jgi:hypothetical protein
VLLYAVMVVNKWALRLFPFPVLLMAVQFLSSAVTVRLLSFVGALECEGLVWARVRSFWLVPLCFGIAIFTNIKLLQVSSVETAIVFRTIVPVFTSAADYIWMGRELPELQSAIGLGIVVTGSVIYAACSRDGIYVTTWMWAWSYIFVLSFEMVYVSRNAVATQHAHPHPTFPFADTRCLCCRSSTFLVQCQCPRGLACTTTTFLPFSSCMLPPNSTHPAYPWGTLVLPSLCVHSCLKA